jgi:hypothetical protein
MSKVTSFLPADYELKESGSDFLKFEDGDTKFRILTPATIFVEGWKDGKPFRRTGPGASIDASEVDLDFKYDANGRPKISEGWAFYVYSHADEKVMILSVTQQTIKKGILTFTSDPDWGSPTDYDLTVTRTDSNGKISYSVKPSPAKPLLKKAQDIVEAAEESFDIVKALSIEAVS